jgi:hypothetical protein
MSGFGLGFGFGVAMARLAAGHTPPTLPRLGLTGAYDSAGDAALVTALAASSADRTRPSFSVSASATRTIAFHVAAVAAPGAILSWIGTRSGYSVAIAESFDSSDGSDGSWSAISHALAFPSGDNAADRRQVAPIAAGGARWVRLAVTAPAGGACTVYPMVHQLPASGLKDIWLVMGASLETQGMLSKPLEDAFIAADPGCDPVVFNYASSGQTSATILTYLNAVNAAFGAYYDYVYLGNLIGNDITAAQPISDDSAQSLIDLRDRVDAIMAGFDGKVVGLTRQTYREYAGVLPTAQADGSLPYNSQVVEPAVLANSPLGYDESLLVPRIDLYSAAMKNRSYLNSVQHFDNYDWMRAEVARSFGRYARTGNWPISHVETLVAAVEASGFAADRYEADAAIASLPASAAKTALSARVAAAAVSPTFVDNLVGASGGLSAHAADTGEAWTSLNGAIVMNVNKAYGFTVPATYRSAWAPATAEYDVAAEILFKTVLGQNVYLLARCADVSNFYYAGCLATGNWLIGRCLAGTFTTLATGAAADLVANRSYQFVFRVRDTAKTLYVNGVQVAQTTDNALTGSGHPGLRISTLASAATTGAHFDRVMANNI